MKKIKMKKNILIVGAGFSGSVLARELANSNFKILVIEKKSHVGGNCYTRRDTSTGIMEHVYGPHIFNTSNQDVWEYVNKFGKMIPFINRVKCSTNKGIFSFPINLHTINQFFGKNFNPSEAKLFIEKVRDKNIRNPKNFEEQALSYIGKDLYDAFFYGYTLKQWGCDPKELPASIIKRIPIRFNYNDNYYNKSYQGIPKNGYTQIIKNILDHKNIKLKTNVSWDKSMINEFDHIFFSGPIDEFFDYKYGQLGYRTVYWKKKIVKGDFQGNAGINYSDVNVKFTRIYEHKHFTPWKEFKKSIVFKEYSKETELGDIPYYPKRLDYDMQKLREYIKEIKNEKKVDFIGRLGTYRYLDMEDVINESLILARKFIKKES